MNELFRALQSMGASPTPEAHKPLDLDWRGKSVRLLTPDEVVEFANAMHREVGRLREERDANLGRAINAEAAVRSRETHIQQLIGERESACGGDPNYDTDLGINDRRQCGED